MANGDKYSGEWKDGKRHGKGTYFYRYEISFFEKNRHLFLNLRRPSLSVISFL